MRRTKVYSDLIMGKWPPDVGRCKLKYPDCVKYMEVMCAFGGLDPHLSVMFMAA